MLEAVSTKHLLTVPRYQGGYWLSTGLNWSRAEDVALAALCHSKAPLEKSADGLGRKPTTLAHRARDARLVLPLEWKEAISTYKSRSRGPTQPLLQYPFIRTAKGEHEALLSVNALVPHGLPGELRADVCQEIMLAIFLGDIGVDELKAEPKLVREFIKNARKDNYEMGGYAMSLDMPMRDGRSWYDVLPDPASSNGRTSDFESEN